MSTTSAQATITDQDRAAIRGILTQYRSPLPAYTIEAFADAHEDFDIAGYLTVMWCESSLGTTGGSRRYNNPGNLKFSRAPGIWYELMSGRWYCRGQGYYGKYPSMYAGQRAAIRILYDANSPWGHSLMPLLVGHQWDSFSRHYFGTGVSGRWAYVRNLRAAHALIVRLAAGYGARW